MKKEKIQYITPDTRRNWTLHIFIVLISILLKRRKNKVKT